MNIPNELLYSKSHEWVKKDNDGTYVIGLTDYAQKELGDLVFVNLPQIDDEITSGGAFGDVESVKAVSDIYSPVTGTVSEINEELLDSPEKINEAPYEAWLVKVVNVSDEEKLLSAEDYESFIKSKEA